MLLVRGRQGEQERDKWVRLRERREEENVSERNLEITVDGNFCFALLCLCFPHNTTGPGRWSPILSLLSSAKGRFPSHSSPASCLVGFVSLHLRWEDTIAGFILPPALAQNHGWDRLQQEPVMVLWFRAV